MGCNPLPTQRAAFLLQSTGGSIHGNHPLAILKESSVPASIQNCRGQAAQASTWKRWPRGETLDLQREGCWCSESLQQETMFAHSHLEAAILLGYLFIIWLPVISLRTRRSPSLPVARPLRSVHAQAILASSLPTTPSFPSSVSFLFHKEPRITNTLR